MLEGAAAGSRCDCSLAAAEACGRRDPERSSLLAAHCQLGAAAATVVDDKVTLTFLAGAILSCGHSLLQPALVIVLLGVWWVGVPWAAAGEASGPSLDARMNAFLDRVDGVWPKSTTLFGRKKNSDKKNFNNLTFIFFYFTNFKEMSLARNCANGTFIFLFYKF